MFFQSAIVSLAAVSALGGFAALLAARTRGRELAPLVLHHILGFAVALLAILNAFRSNAPDGGLVVCGASLFGVLLVDAPDRARMARWPLWIFGLGVALQAIGQVGGAAARLSAPVGGALVAGASVIVVGRAWRARSAAVVPRAKARLEARIAIGASLMLCGLLSALPRWLVPDDSWPLALGAASALATQLVVASTAPPSGRDVLAGALMTVLALVAAAFTPFDLRIVAFMGLWAGTTSVAVHALARAALAAMPRPIPGRRARVGQGPAWGKTAAEGPALPAAGALAALQPLLDDAMLRRPGRPRVLARVAARRIVEASIERAQRAQAVGRDARDAFFRVDVTAPEVDVDLDVDAGEVAEALCAALDNALRAPGRPPDHAVALHLRSTTSTVLFEVVDGAVERGPDSALRPQPNPDTPFQNGRGDDVDRPGLGVALARARLLVERNGGTLDLRVDEGGTTVQIVLPRRQQRVSRGTA